MMSQLSIFTPPISKAINLGIHTGLSHRQYLVAKEIYEDMYPNNDYQYHWGAEWAIYACVYVQRTDWDVHHYELVYWMGQTDRTEPIAFKTRTEAHKAVLASLISKGYTVNAEASGTGQEAQ